MIMIMQRDKDKLAYGVTFGTLRGFLPSGASYTETLLLEGQYRLTE